MPKWTTDQQTAIDDRGGALLVSAAAGSGKTAVLTERVLTLITDPERPVDIDRLLIVTFSNAAAEEMRQRIAARLYERMEQEPENAVLRRQSLLLGNAEICTIHAFCYRLIRENFQALGLPGDMALGRDGEDELLQAAVLEQLLDEEYEKAEPAFMRLIELFSGSRNDRRVMASLLLLYHFLRNHPFYRDWAAEYITADTETPLDETIWSGLLRQRAAEALQYADDLLRDCMDLLGQSNDEMLWEVVTPVIMQDREMLARLKAEGVRMCICSNTWAEQCEEVLTRLGVADYFEFFYTAQGAKSKAHPEVFHEVLERLGGSEPADAVVCEDAVYATRTARQCGFYLIDIEDETSAADQPELQRLADQYITDWTQLDWTKL